MSNSGFKFNINGVDVDVSEETSLVANSKNVPNLNPDLYFKLDGSKGLKGNQEDTTTYILANNTEILGNLGKYWGKYFVADPYKDEGYYAYNTRPGFYGDKKLFADKKSCPAPIRDNSNEVMNFTGRLFKEADNKTYKISSYSSTGSKPNGIYISELSSDYIHWENEQCLKEGDSLLFIDLIGGGGGGGGGLLRDRIPRGGGGGGGGCFVTFFFSLIAGIDLIIENTGIAGKGGAAASNGTGGGETIAHIGYFNSGKVISAKGGKGGYTYAGAGSG